MSESSKMLLVRRRCPEWRALVGTKLPVVEQQVMKDIDQARINAAIDAYGDDDMKLLDTVNPAYMLATKYKWRPRTWNFRFDECFDKHSAVQMRLDLTGLRISRRWGYVCYPEGFEEKFKSKIQPSAREFLENVHWVVYKLEEV